LEHKGALTKVLEVCTWAEQADGSTVPLLAVEAAIQRIYAEWSREGDRLLGVAERSWEAGGAVVPRAVRREDESGMTFLGLVALSDPLKPGLKETVADLDRMGVRLKIITGDNALVTERIAREAGLQRPEVVTGAQLDKLSDLALPVRAENADVFAEIEPRQKERLIRALRRGGHVVGYIGDGINDTPAMHAADVSLSVQGANDNCGRSCGS
jgi:Mg2+-importing ATPase